MNRRDSIKSIVLGSIAGGSLVSGCKEEPKEQQVEQWPHTYGRTPEEKALDEKLLEAQFFDAHEMTTITVLVDIICPKDETSGSATEAGVPEFIEFMVKDYPIHQVPMRGGVKWLDRESLKRFDKAFVELSNEQQLEIVDDIAYPEKDDVAPRYANGAAFFSRLRDLTMTGFFTSEMGIEALGYMGNRPNNWDGVPQDVLQKHGFAYEKDWNYQFVDHATKGEIAQWDEDGNLLNG